MTGERNLDTLLAAMSPVLIAGKYVFCSFENSQYGDHTELKPIAACKEPEGLTLVIPKSKADEKGLHYETTHRGILLRVHSSLEAVGLTAAFSAKLAEHGISANVIAGFYHDQIFVQSNHARRALAALEELAQ